MIKYDIIYLSFQRLLIIKLYFNLGKRNIYESAAIGLDKYAFYREKLDNQFSDPEKQTFRDRMHAFADPESNSLIFTEDLKQMVHLTNNDEADLKLIEKMIKKYVLVLTYFF